MAPGDEVDARLLEERSPERSARAFWQITRTWLSAPDRGNARWLLLGVMALTVAQVAIQIRFNLWNRDFFNALENRNGEAFRWQIVVFLVLAALSMTVAVYHLYVAQLLKLRWREWLTRRPAFRPLDRGADAARRPCGPLGARRGGRTHTPLEGDGF